MTTKPRISKGTRDFNSQQLGKRDYILSTIKSNFIRYGFEPIETPSFELSQTLLGKYGEEGDRLIFKILNSGEKIKKVDLQALKKNELSRFSNSLSEKALRYDLTVPLARYVVQYQNDIAFPFKRYQIQPVWRADRPQKGRFQEFYQCDADAVGSNSLWQEVEFIQLYDAVFADLKLEGVCIKINNRKILAAIANLMGAQDKLWDFTVSLDKLDKIGPEKVKEEMLLKGISPEGIKSIEPLFKMQGSFDSQLKALKVLLKNSEIGLTGLSELQFISEKIQNLGLKIVVLKLDVTLARGLNYYTGAIFEVSAPNKMDIGSLGGGGRYDNLTGIFGLQGMSGVGISFGLDRIAIVLDELALFPKCNLQSTQVLFTNFGSKEGLYSYKAIQRLRAVGVVAELFPDACKLKKQISYANKRGIPYVVLVGDQEMLTNTFTLKNMKDGNQFSLNLKALITRLRNQKNP